LSRSTDLPETIHRIKSPGLGRGFFVAKGPRKAALPFAGLAGLTVDVVTGGLGPIGSDG